MKKNILLVGLTAMVVSFSANAGSILRIQCEDEDAGTEVYINGKQIGACPLDAPVGAGTIRLSARSVKGDYERVFEKQIRVFDNVAQRVEIVLSAPQLTASARNRRQAEEANAKARTQAAEAKNQLAAAENGNIEAMKKMAEYYDAGMGVERSPAKAKVWRDKAEAATVQTQLRAANAGNIPAMEAMSARYAAGRGVSKDATQAQLWRNKAAAAKHQNLAQQKARDKQQRMDSISFFGFTKTITEKLFQDPNSSIITSPLLTAWALVFDLTSAPFRTTDLVEIQNEAALRPSTWGKPDSMIARASRQHEETSLATESFPLVVAIQ